MDQNKPVLVSNLHPFLFTHFSVTATDPLTPWLVIYYFFLFACATTLCGSWPLPWSSSVGSGGLVAVDSSRAGLLAQPQTGGPGTTLRLAPTISSVWHRWLYQQLMLPSA
jgi:hypothetical protein